MNSRRALASLAFAAVALAAAPACARIFYVIQSSPDAWSVMDPEGVERVAGSPVRKAWDVRVQRNILSGDPPQPGYVRTLTEYDCQAQRTRWREFTAFSRSGALLVSKVNPNPEWGPADESSDTYAAYRVICEGAGQGAVLSADSVAKVVIRLMGSWDPPAQPLAPVLPPPAPGAKPGTQAAKPGTQGAKPPTPPAKAATPAAKPAASATPTKPR
ncbi:MAG: hypothetical protein JNL41_06290 [Phenylobacterium sp.]|uniref:surface-adhesin E family protein n=1 Tax=Phenylobacterium sp. TaxID=1871053 RepID=UPI001A4662D5|nr:surface-adhesin E family protein [Phenylobacterium sp.]MBL8553870.1 hypothetical protein [Phenylobacterium sp.]